MLLILENNLLVIVRLVGPLLDNFQSAQNVVPTQRSTVEGQMPQASRMITTTLRLYSIVISLFTIGS
jgi:hypothetical protein